MVSRRPFFVAAVFGVLSLTGFAQTTASPMLLPAVTPPDEHAFTDWARSNAIPLKTTLPDDDFSDMAPLGDVIGNARIVGLGEATHGTSEFFQMKDRMVRYLAMQKGFTIFSIEANMPEAYRLNDYVLNGVGDPNVLLKGMNFWTWNTQEVLDMILWMRQYNLSGKGRIEFTGFDMQTPTLSLENVRQFVAKYDPAYGPALAEAYKDVPPDASQVFGVATAQIPVSVAAGHRITLSGYIKTEDVENGFAGFWMRVDGSQGSPVAFDNMGDRGPKGTTAWTRYEITLNAPADARAIYFGALHPGTGTAWFDSLEIEIDGVPYTNPSAMDLDFESGMPLGFHVGGEGYQEQLDPTVAHTGRQSLKIKRTRADDASGSQNNVQEGRKLQLCRGVLNELEAKRSAFLKAGASRNEVEWAIQNARLVVQYEELKAGEQGVRDRAMAENIEWIADQNPGTKIIVWAHNGHVGYLPLSNTMGSYLKKDFGAQYMNFGFAFNQGSFRAFDLEKLTLTTFNVPPAPKGTWDEALTATNIPSFALNLRMVVFDPKIASWMSAKHRTRSVGCCVGGATNYWDDTQLQDKFDAVFFLDKTTAAHGLP